jgi:TPR repeat protein
MFLALGLVVALVPGRVGALRVSFAEPETAQSIQTEAPDIGTLTAKAAAGDAESQFQLGQRYLGGTAVPQDASAARMWCGKSAQQNHPGGLSCFGYLNLTGMGRFVDLVAARTNLERAVALGRVGAHAASQSNALARLASRSAGPLSAVVRQLLDVSAFHSRRNVRSQTLIP